MTRDKRYNNWIVTLLSEQQTGTLYTGGKIIIVFRTNEQNSGRDNPLCGNHSPSIEYGGFRLSISKEDKGTSMGDITVRGYTAWKCSRPYE
jgi:hypothetical protein